MILTRKNYNKDMKIFNFTAVLLSFLLISHQAKAQDALNESGMSAGQTIIFSGEEKADEVVGDIIEPPPMNIDREAEVTIIKDKYAGDYLQPTVENLSKLYWKKNALDIKNDAAIDNYLLINECPIYQRVHDDDFEWLRVQKAGRKMIEEQKAGFSDKFKMVIPIDLGRYDMQRKGFPLINNTSFLDLRRVEIGGNSTSTDICGNIGNIEHYPRNVILILSKPFSYDFIDLDEHIAQAYIIRQKYDPIIRPKELENADYNRLAFARMRISFDKYQGETKGIDGQRLAIMFGKLDGIDIFEDAAETQLLTSIDLK